MGRLKVTPKGKVKKNIPITRVGKKQYLKRRFAADFNIERAGATNAFTQKYFKSVMGKRGIKSGQTASHAFTSLGLNIDPSSSLAQVAERKKRVKKEAKRVFEEGDQAHLDAINEASKNAKIGRPVSEQEGSTIANLIQRYGTDLKRMTLDAKLNPFQLNVRQLQRQIVNYLKWEKASFPEAFAEAERKGWFSVEQFADKSLRSSQKNLLRERRETP